MSNLRELVNELRASGVHLAVDGDKLRYRAPKGVLTEELKQRLAIQKAEIIRLLQAESAGTYREKPPYPDNLGRVKCFYCSKLEITGAKAVCRVSRDTVTGIALLTTCESFVMTTAHYRHICRNIARFDFMDNSGIILDGRDFTALFPPFKEIKN
jgi:hypothetical protein